MNLARLALSIAAISTILLVDPPRAAARPKPPAPESVRHYEVIDAVTQSPMADGGIAVSFRAFDRSFDLVLATNPLFSTGADDVWVSGKGAPHERKRMKPQARVYKGAVAGEPGSWVRVRLRNAILDGVVRSGGELYFVESAARFFRSRSETGMVVYRLSDTESDLGPGSCALESPATAESLAASADALSTSPTLLPEFQSLAATATKQIDLALVADYEYYVEHGAASASDMQAVLNQVDGILQAELGLTLRITRTVVHTSAQDPFTSTTDAVGLLNELSTYKASSWSPIYGSDLAQLFTNRDLAGSTVGIAWVASLCSGAWGSSIAQDFTTTAKSLTILSAHEIGHNLAAPHDAQTGSVCSQMPFGYIMYPSVSTALNLQFSSCSKSTIAAHVSKATCLADVPSSTPSPPPPPPATPTPTPTPTTTPTASATPTPAPTCSFAISPSSASLGAPGGTGSVTVVTMTGCPWTASSSASWLAITWGTSGSGFGVVRYAAAANSTSAARTATLTIAGRTFTVTQAAATVSSMIRVVAPNGGETWPIGASRTITWSSSGAGSLVKIELSRDGGSTWSVLASSTANDGSHPWIVTSPATARARFRVTSLSSAGLTDASDGDVRLDEVVTAGGVLTVSSPNGGESWAFGSVQTIRWTSTNVTGWVAIESSSDGVFWSPITSFTANDGAHTWSVYSPRSTTARVRIRSLGTPAVGDTSDGVFTIR